MTREQEIRKQVGVSLLTGIGLLGIVYFIPDSGGRFGEFFQIAKATTWGRPLEWPAAWCSLKIIISSVALFLIIEAMATILLQMKRRRMAMTVFFTQVVSLFIFFSGAYYFIKALL